MKALNVRNALCQVGLLAAKPVEIAPGFLDRTRALERQAVTARRRLLAQVVRQIRRLVTIRKSGDAHRAVEREADLVLVEGAGSPAEINLREGDIANMGFAVAADLPVVLVGDIDRGGVIASLVGTHTVLPPDERRRIRGFLVNRFRGDLSLFSGGLEVIERMTGWPSFGVVPWLPAARRLPAEDAIPERASGLVPVADDVKTKLQTKVESFIDELIATDSNSPEFGKKVDQLTNMGRKEIAQAAGMSNRFLDRPVKAIDADTGIGADLTELRRTVEKLDPSANGKLLTKKKFLGIIPFGNRINNYFDA